MFKKFFIILILFLCQNFNENKQNFKIISTYLNKLNSLSANFIQVNQNGEHSNGKIRIEKPGKIRIDFENNNKSLIGDGRKIALINKKFSQITYYNYDQIPLKILLSTEFSLESFIVKDFVDYENIIEIELSENNTKNNGSIRLIFENNPLKLKKWIVNEFNGGKIEIFLSNLEVNKKMNNNFFRIESPKKLDFNK